MRMGLSNKVGFGPGMAEITSLNPNKFSGEVYFEVHPDRLEKENINIEIYGKSRIPLLTDCGDSGPLLARSKSNAYSPPLQDKFSSSVFAFPTYNDIYKDDSIECHPRASNAVMAAAEFSIDSPYDASGQAFAQDGETFLYCVKVVLDPPVMSPREQAMAVVHTSKENDESFIDTKFEISGTVNDATANVNDLVRVFSTKAIDSKQQYVASQVIDVKAFLCKIPDVTNPQNNFQAPFFSVGQIVSICVGPSGETASEAVVSGFQNVICANNGQSRVIVEDGRTDFLTTVAGSALGFVDIITGQMLPGGAGILSVQTIVTTGWLQLGDTSMECTGEVLVQPTSNRRLQDGSSTSLERETRDGVTKEFKVNVGLSQTFVGPQSSAPRNQGLSFQWVFGTLLVAVTATVMVL